MSEIRTNLLKSERGDASPSAPYGLRVSGVSTTTTLNVTGNATISGNLGVAGTITYEDVARVDATGISTFREGFKLGPLAGIALTAYKDGSIRTSGIITAASFVGDGSGLTGAGPSLANGSNNRVVTATGANALTGEANLTFTGSILTVTNSGGASELTLTTPNNTDGGVYFNDGSNAGALSYQHSDDSMRFRVNSTEKLRIDSNGNIGVNCDSPTNISGHKGITLQGTNANAGFINFMDSADNSDARILASDGELHIHADPSDNTGSSEVVFFVDNNREMSIDDGGRVLKPNTPHFNCNGSPTIGSSSDLYVARSFGNVNANVGNHYNNSNGRFTAPVGGTYLFGSGLWCNNNDQSSGAHLLVFRKNGAEAGFGCNHRTQQNQLHATMCIVLSTNDHITTGFASGSGGSIQGSTPRNYFWGYLVG